MTDQIDFSDIPEGLVLNKLVMSEAEVRDYAKRIKPVVLSEGNLYFCTRDVDPCKMSFLWDAVPGKKATNLKELKAIWTLHTFGYYGFFKPSVEEVIRQIPTDLLDKVSCFYTRGPYEAADLSQTKVYLKKGFQVARTILYGQEGNNENNFRQFRDRGPL